MQLFNHQLSILLIPPTGYDINLEKQQVSNQVSNTEIRGIPNFILYFRVDKSNIDPTYMNNAAVLNQMKNIVNEQNIAYIDSLIISAYASPEAPSLYNKILSERRANAVKEYFLKEFSMLKPESVQAYGHGENWSDLRRMAEEDGQIVK